MEKDRLTTFNIELAADLQKMNDDELWSFILSKEEAVKEFNVNNRRLQTAVFFAYRGGREHYRTFFLAEIEDCREKVIYTLILDFCLGDEKIPVEYWARSGFLDSPDSCKVKTSREVMPNLDDLDEEECYFSKKYFHLLENNDTQNIIKSLKKSLYMLSENTFEDISKIEAMREFCEKNQSYRIAYIYDVAEW